MKSLPKNIKNEYVNRLLTGIDDQTTYNCIQNGRRGHFEYWYCVNCRPDDQTNIKYEFIDQNYPRNHIMSSSVDQNNQK